MFLYERDGKVCVAFGSDVPKDNPEYILDIDDLAKTLEVNGKIISPTTTEALESDLVVDTAVQISSYTFLDLNGNTVSAPNDTAGDGVYHVVSGGTLVINGDGEINGVGDNDYNMAIWADGGKVIINGGKITNKGATGKEDPSHFDLVYVKNGGVVEINGGYFECETPKWTLNSNDTNPGKFIVTGGTFVDFDPSKVDTEPTGGATNWVAEGYKVIQEGNLFTVVRELP